MVRHGRHRPGAGRRHRCGRQRDRHRRGRDGYLTLYPCGATAPTSSTLNFAAGSNVPNLATSGLGTNGALCVFTNVNTDVVIDLAGWYRNNTGAAFTGQAPVRVLDTRPSGQPTQAAAVDLTGQVPSGTTAVAVNITATQPAAAGYVTAYPCGTTRRPRRRTSTSPPAPPSPTPPSSPSPPTAPSASPASAPTHLVVDLAGAFAGSGTTMTAVTPARLLDTRAGIGGWIGRLGAGQTVDLAVAGRPGIPTGARSAVFNVTVTGAASDGYLTVYPCGTPVPTASNVNYRAGDTRANQVTVDLGADGRACFFSNAPTNVIADLTGYLN